jgi:hypothetical protein
MLEVSPCILTVSMLLVASIATQDVLVRSIHVQLHTEMQPREPSSI